MSITINGSGTLTGLSAGGLPDGSVVAADLASGAITSGALPAGSILQVKQTVKTDTGSFTSTNTNTFVDIPGMSVSITPSSTSSKILVLFTANVSQSTSATIHIRLTRGSTSIFQGDAAGNRFGSTQINRTASTPYVLEIPTLFGSFLDSPSTTSATTYKLQGTLGSTYSGTFYVNRSSLDENLDYGGRTASSIIVMEVAG